MKALKRRQLLRSSRSSAVIVGAFPATHGIRSSNSDPGRPMSDRIFYEPTSGGVAWFVCDESTLIFEGVNKGRGSRDFRRDVLYRTAEGVWIKCEQTADGPWQHTGHEQPFWQVSLKEASQWFPKNYKEAPDILFKDLEGELNRGNSSRLTGQAESDVIPKSHNSATGSDRSAGNKDVSPHPTTPGTGPTPSEGSGSSTNRSKSIPFLRLDGSVGVLDRSTAEFHDGSQKSRQGRVSVASLIRFDRFWLTGWKELHSGMGARTPQLKTDPMPKEVTPTDAAKFCSRHGIPLPAALVAALNDLAIERTKPTVRDQAVETTDRATDGSTPRSEHTKTSNVVVTLHGIKTRGVWQKDIDHELSRAGFIPKSLDYGHFYALQLLWPPSRRKKVEWLRDEYTRMCDPNDNPRPSVIAHSFGTYLVARAIAHYGLKFDRIVFCGAIVGRSYPWSTYFSRDCVRAVLNDFGRQDFWAWVVAWVVKDGGQSGYRGFTDTADGRVIQIEHEEFRHSDYFFTLNYRESWLPFLRGEAQQRMAPTVIEPANWRFRITASLLMVLILVLGLVGYLVYYFRS